MAAGSAALITNTAAGGDAVTLSNVGGTIEIRGLSISANDVGILATTTGTTNLNLTVANNTFPSAGTDGIRIVPDGSVGPTVSVSTNTFTNMTSDAFQIGASALGASGTSTVTFSGNTISPSVASGGGVNIGGQELTTTTFTVANNVFTNARGNGIVRVDVNDTATASGTVSNNTITTPTDSTGVAAWVDEGGTLRVTVTGNAITNAGVDGVQMANFGGIGTSTLSAAVTNNTITGHSLSAAPFIGGIGVFGFEDDTCLKLAGNTVSGTPGGFFDVYLEHSAGTFTFEEVPNTGATGAVTAPFITSLNPGVTETNVGVVGSVNVSNGVACVVPLIAAGAPAPGTAAAPLAADQVAPTVHAALERLVSAGLPAAERAQLASVPVTLGDLGSGLLAMSNAASVQIDRDGAGHGWFVDATPADDDEYPAAGDGAERRATADSPAAGRMDLLTVVAHELLHAMGRMDLDPSTHPGALMAGTLPAGARRVPTEPLALAARPIDASMPAPQGPSPSDLMRAARAGRKAPADPVDVALGTLPAGKSVTVTLRATIDVSPAYTAALSVQATVTADGDLSVTTDDPDTGAAGDATDTPVSYPAPTVTSITPASGSAAGGTGVMLAGTHFLDGATVTIGSDATGVTAESQLQINATTSATPAGVADVTVTNPDGQSATLADGFTYTCSYTLSDDPAPFGPIGGAATVTITAIAPSCGWSATSADAWITLTPPAAGVGSGSVDYSVAPNDSPLARTGSIDVNGATVTITQRGRSGGSLDVNGDGLGDVLIYRKGAVKGPYEAQLSDGAGGFIDGWAGDLGPGRTLAAGDFDGDGAADLLTYRAANGQWTLWMAGKGSMTVAASGTWPTRRIPVVTDLTGDGRADVLLYNRPSGAWQACVTTVPGSFSCTTGRWPGGIVAVPGDQNGDGLADFLVYQRLTGQWHWAQSDGTGNFSTAVSGTWPWGLRILALDLNGDGLSDTVRYVPGTSQVVVSLNLGGAFTDVEPALGRVHDALAGDFNGDGRADLVLYLARTGQSSIRFSDGLGGFTTTAVTWPARRKIFVTDLNGDGRSDMLFYSPTSGEWRQALTTSPGVFTHTAGSWAAGLTVTAMTVRFP